MTRQSTRLDPKDVGESDVVTFDFTQMLNVGETILSASVTAEVYAGTDPTPSNLLFNAAQIQGLKVLQAIQSGVVGVEYLLRCSIGTNAATPRTLVLSGLINVIKI